MAKKKDVKKKEVQQVIVKPMRRATIEVGIRGISSLVLKQWSRRSIAAIERKHAGDKTKVREPRDPEAESQDATYRLSDNCVGFPAVAFKKAMVEATDKDLGLPKTLVRRGLFVVPDEGMLVAIKTPGVKMRQDTVRVGVKQADLRYRPEMTEWGASLRIEYDQDILTAESVINLLNRAGFGVGVGEYRPEKNGVWGRFEVVGTDDD